MGKVKLTDELQSVKAEVAKLKASGVEFIIALGHSGLGTDQRIAREVDGVDVVVGGHSHSYLFSGESGTVSNIFYIELDFIRIPNNISYVLISRKRTSNIKVSFRFCYRI